MIGRMILTECPLANCPLAKCPVANCRLAKCPLANCLDTPLLDRKEVEPLIRI